jgi:hypothetical protein
MTCAVGGVIVSSGCSAFVPTGEMLMSTSTLDVTVDDSVLQRYDILLSSLQTTPVVDHARSSAADAVIALLRKGLGAQLFVTGSHASRTFLSQEPITISAFLQNSQERQWFTRAADLLMDHFPNDSLCDIAPSPPPSCGASDESKSVGPSSFDTTWSPAARARRATVATILAHGSGVMLEKIPPRRYTLPPNLSAGRHPSEYPSWFHRESLSVADDFTPSAHESVPSTGTVTSARASASSQHLDMSVGILSDLDSGEAVSRSPDTCSAKMVIQNVAVVMGKKKRLQVTSGDIALVIQSNAVHDLSYLAVLEDMNKVVGKNNLVKRTMLLFRSWCENDGSHTALTLSIPESLRDFVCVERPAVASLPWNCVVVLLLWLFARKASRLHHPLIAFFHLIIDLATYNWESQLDISQLQQVDAITASAMAILSTFRQKYGAFPKGMEDSSTKSLDCRQQRLFVADLLDSSQNTLEFLRDIDCRRIVQEFQGAAIHLTKLFREARLSTETQLHQIDCLLAGSWASVDCSGTVDQTSVPDTSAKYFTVDVPAIVRSIDFCSFLLATEVSEGALISIAEQVLKDRGCLPVGEIGKLLQEATNNPNLPHQLKERFGGLKRFLEADAGTFFLAANHPFNPHVYLRNTLSPEQVEILSRPPNKDGAGTQFRAVAPQNGVTFESAEYEDSSLKGKSKRKKSLLPVASTADVSSFSKDVGPGYLGATARTPVHSWPAPMPHAAAATPRWQPPRGTSMPMDHSMYDGGGVSANPRVTAHMHGAHQPAQLYPQLSRFASQGSSLPYRGIPSYQDVSFDAGGHPERPGPDYYAMPQHSRDHPHFSRFAAPARASAMPGSHGGVLHRSFDQLHEYPIDSMAGVDEYSSYLSGISGPVSAGAHSDPDALFNAFSSGSMLGLGLRPQQSQANPSMRPPPGLEIASRSSGAGAL